MREKLSRRPVEDMRGGCNCDRDSIERTGGGRSIMAPRVAAGRDGSWIMPRLESSYWSIGAGLVDGRCVSYIGLFDARSYEPVDGRWTSV